MTPAAFTTPVGENERREPGRPMDWLRDGQDWPNRSLSRFVDVGGQRWHVQEAGTGPKVLLVHGTGASTHSFRDLLPALCGGGGPGGAPAASCHVLAPDLPGHAFSATPPDGDLSITAMAGGLAALLEGLAFRPDLVVGHSAGAAILARMALDGRLSPRAIVSVNGAFFPFGGMAGQLFAPLARLLAATHVAPRLFARLARDPEAVDRLLDGTGSQLDAVGRQGYTRLFTDVTHVRTTLGMMASWDLHGLQRSLACLTVPLVLVVGERDRAVPPAEAERIRERVAAARVIRLEGLGHLAHEEAPEALAALIREQLPTTSPRKTEG